MNHSEPSTEAARLPSAEPASVPFQGRFVLKWALIILPLGYLWFRLISNLWPEWDTNPQYSYGLVVPLLVVGLLLRRWFHHEHPRGGSLPSNPWIAIWVCALLAFFYLPTRLIEAATPEWRPIQWVLAVETIGLTLYAVYLAGGRGWLRQAAFPALFFFVAVPWPTLIEAPIVQGLTQMNAALVVEVLGILNVPAVQHGNTIQVSSGMVGVSDACSGIRSLQSCLMIALFLGEFYRFNWRRRLLLLPVGFALAMALNLFRAALLTWIAAKKGVNAIAEYHDEAGITILLVCTGLLWGVAWLLTRRKTPAGEASAAAVKLVTPSEVDRVRVVRRVNRLGLVLILWLVAVESGVALWYQIRESQLKPGPSWSVSFPTNNPTFKALPLTRDEHVLLQFDDGRKGQWDGPEGTTWQAFYFDWKPGRVAGYLAKRHTPDICLTAVGMKMMADPNLFVLLVNGIELPIRHYIFDNGGSPLQVYQIHWEAGEGSDSYTADESSRFNLIRGVWAGRGNKGQKSLEIVISGFDDPKQARAALEEALVSLIQVEL